jgi:hypothetical protein
LPAGFTLLTTQEFTIRPGADVLVCHYLNTFAPQDADLLIAEIHSYQLQYGHHVSLNYTEETQPADSHECAEADMTRTLLVGAGNESSELRFTLPTDVVVRVPRGRQIVMQSHYINPTNAPIRVRDAITYRGPAAGRAVDIADPYAFNDGDFSIPPRTMGYGRTLECTMDRDMNVVNLFGHAHEYATRLWIERAPAGSDRFEMLYNESGAGGRLQSNPPMRYYDRSNVLRLRAGDRVRVNCNWDNTSNNTLHFPQEMCAGVMYAYPGAGFRSCGTVVETRGAPAADGGTTGMGNAGCDTPPSATDRCVRPCNTGNELGVGRYCTRGGGQCTQNIRAGLPAVICSADVETAQPSGWCLKPCANNAGCGSGAVCTGDERGRGCVPVACAPSSDDGGVTDASTPTDGARDASAD